MKLRHLSILASVALFACKAENEQPSTPETSQYEAAEASESHASEPEERGEHAEPTSAEPTPSQPAGEPANADPVAALRTHEAELMTRTEKDATEVRVQHVLIAFKGAMRSQATRSKEDAEKLTADIYAKLLAGGDIGALMREYSDDPGAGVYTMTTGRGGGGVFPRTGMVPAFGNVGWRLEVGEVGVAPYDANNSPFGWHIIKRLK